MVKLAPSILSADFSHLGAEIDDCLRCGADYIHFDVMDGIFVNNISFGIPVLASLRKSTDAFLDVHLMIDRPVRYAEAFCNAGADLVNFHVESDTQENILAAIDLVKARGIKTGITIKPCSTAENVLPFIEKVDLILVMTVEPGKGGQKFMSEQLPVIRKVREYIDRLNPVCELEVDGGVNLETAGLAVAAGSNVLVSGSSFFKAEDRLVFANVLKNS